MNLLIKFSFCISESTWIWFKVCVNSVNWDVPLEECRESLSTDESDSLMLNFLPDLKSHWWIIPARLTFCIDHQEPRMAYFQVSHNKIVVDFGGYRDQEWASNSSTAWDLSQWLCQCFKLAVVFNVVEKGYDILNES